VIDTSRLRIAYVAPEHAPALRAFYERNHAHLAPWEPTRPAGFYTQAFWDGIVLDAVDERHADRGYRFVAFAHDDAATLLATVNLNHVVRGAFSAATMGYSVDGAVEGRGYGTEAVGAVVDYAFDALRLHRVMANYQPVNERSGRLLRRIGFSVEGYARDYLFLDGAWRDHVLTARTNPVPGFRP